MYLFVTLLMKRKISGSNNQHFHFTGKWKQGAIHLRSSTFGTFELIEKLMLGKWLCQYAVKSSYKQVWIILQFYPITVEWQI